MKFNGSTGSVACILTAGVLWGCMSPVTRGLSLLGTDMLTVAFFRALLVALGSGIFLALRDRRSLRVNSVQMACLCISGALIVGGIYGGFALTYRYLSVPVAIVIFATYPLITAVGAVFVNGESLSSRKLVAVAAGICGIIVTFVPLGSFASVQIDPRGLFWAALAAAGTASFSLIGRRCSQTGFLSQASFFFYSHLWGVLWIGLAKTMAGGWGDLVTTGGVQWVGITYVGLIASLVGYSLYLLGLRGVEASRASILAMNEMITALVAGAVMLHRLPLPRELFGLAFIMAAICIVPRQNRIEVKCVRRRL